MMMQQYASTDICWNYLSEIEMEYMEEETRMDKRSYPTQRKEWKERKG